MCEEEKLHGLITACSFGFDNVFVVKETSFISFVFG